jgi:hypothetical protein
MLAARFQLTWDTVQVMEVAQERYEMWAYYQLFCYRGIRYLL